MLSHQDVTGVGYGVGTYLVTGEDPERHFLKDWTAKKEKILMERIHKEDTYVHLARKSLINYLLCGEYLKTTGRPSEGIDAK